MDATSNDGAWVRALRTPEGDYVIGGTVVTNVHSAESCTGDPCVIHNPTRHRLSHWPQLYRDDRNIVERICTHGVGHPDPDQWSHWSKVGALHEQVHGCCGCCHVQG